MGFAVENAGQKVYFLCCFDGAVTLGQEQLLKPMRPRPLPERLLIVLPIVWILAGLLAQGATSQGAPALGKFSAIQATSLDRTHMHLPANFSGQLNLVIISFAREQQQAVDTWIPAARKIESAHGQFRFYELITMSRENLLYRWWFDESLRSNTTDKGLRSRILTAYVNKRAFKKSLHIENEKRVVAILVDPKGTVYWRGDGSCADSDMSALLSVLAAHGE
ncbi:MAG: hypothetical protein WCE63_07315 [Acidobacteriaceae bacterium]